MIKGRYFFLFIALLLLGACKPITPTPRATVAVPPTPTPGVTDTVQPTATVANDETMIVNINQGWNKQTQLNFWFTSQGSQIIPYTWFLALEQASNPELFRSDKNMRRLGYLPAAKDVGNQNPDNLPIGFAKSIDTNGDWIGFTCAACHTTQINYQRVGLFIDGGPTLADFNTFYGELVESMHATLMDTDKFDRFAKHVLGSTPTSASLKALRTSLIEMYARHKGRFDLNKPDHEPGYGRLDAFGNIFNQALVTALKQPENAKPPNAPVSYPFLWDTPQHDFVQWNGSAANGPLRVGELARNTGEVVGVFGGLNITDCDSLTCKYSHNIDLLNLGKLEAWLGRLWSPQWDAKHLTPIDQSMAQQGKIHYDKYCVAGSVPLTR